MLFSSITFLYWYLPAVLALYYIVPRVHGSLLWRNCFLLIASLFFYAWGEPLYVLIMLAQALIGWGSGLVLVKCSKDRSKKRSKVARVVFIIAIVLEVGALLFFKYTDFFIDNLNALFHSQFSLLALALPLGISFYTFQILSYTIDLYRGKVAVQKNPLYFATYVTLFPQLIAGPIVRYADIEQQLTNRRHTLEGFTRGIRRFCIGLAKKILIANTLGQLVAISQSAIIDSSAAIFEQSTLFAVLFLVAFTLQIYFDFSGYSDMAIGLGLMFGFSFLENFNYPLIAKSVTDFWRRWHISMSSWFRDYLYIPLGGNRVTVPRHILNIAAVWMTTGFWHGAGWNFVCWGLLMAVFLLVEKFVLSRLLVRMPAAVGHLYLLVVVMLGWVLFESPDLNAAIATVEALVGLGSGGFAGSASLYYLRDFAVPIIFAAIGCTPIPALLLKRFSERVLIILEPVFIAAVLIVVTAFLVDGSFNPFIYFRF